MGGIVPKLAHHAHMRNLPDVVKEAIQKANLGDRGVQEIDVIAVTRVDPEFKVLTRTGDSPRNSDDAALVAPLGPDPYPPFPFLTLLVSGGHTMLLVAHSVDRYTTLATTVDDSIGEAFDKTARELDIPWLPGRAGGPGASLEEFAKTSTTPARYLDQLPIPMSLRASKHEMKFSFAGLKSAVTRVVNHEKKTSASGQMDEDKKRDLAAGFQHCAVTHLCQKVEQGLRDCRKQGIDISSLVISGGVGRNATLRKKMDSVCQQFEYSLAKPSQKPKTAAGGGSSVDGTQHGTSSMTDTTRRAVQVICPPPKLCTDNAVMIAWTGLERYQLGLVDPYDIDIVPKWPLDMLGTGVIPE
ncbi:hypothetical protein BGW38_006859 [Lunasporangiospora selenospora]|uniref:N(6)-L-threonylcarbamoyladenine synthase n=1 Tax=Lunasporangiospora selenospora TaxID=979761 RepID=A0A9P6KAJ8_9FUNG|nr:hypothetical protein BGW38_006859 [Lunasporangiospora selenospora]